MDRPHPRANPKAKATEQGDGKKSEGKNISKYLEPIPGNTYEAKKTTQKDES